MYFSLQRLEFLGDSVLDFLVTEHMYNEYPGLSPGLLTDLRSASVNNDCYARSAIKADLYKHILHASQELHRDIITTLRDFDKLSSEPAFGWETRTFPKVSHSYFSLLIIKQCFSFKCMLTCNTVLCFLYMYSSIPLVLFMSKPKKSHKMASVKINQS